MLLVFFASIFFISSAHGVSAEGSNLNPLNWASNATYAAFQYLLYGVFLFVGLFTSVATTMFAYAVDPQFISGPTGLLNLQAVYQMWKFVRDFINIFFILGLLFIAFAFVFQIDSYANSKTIIKLILAALLVNFSFPIARIIIDFANVPMYFFLQMILGDGGDASTTLASSLGASNLEGILLPQGSDSELKSLLAAIVFLFIFNITLLVLAFQFLIRVIALVILLVLSPIGFIGNDFAGIPGMKKYGGKWWDEFLNYCLFGPAAMFMLVLATNFFAAISGSNQSDGVGNIASATSIDKELISSMVLFFVPITMLWFTMGVSKQFSVAGADIATKYGKDFAKWAGKKSASVATSPVTTRAKGFGEGIKKRTYEGRLFGDNKASKLVSGKYWKERGENTKAYYKGMGDKLDGTPLPFGRGKESKAGMKEIDKLKRKRINELTDENKKNNVSTASLLGDLNGGDQIKKAAAALALAENGSIQSTEMMYKALDAIKNDKGEFDEDFALKIIEKAKGDSFDDVSSKEFADKYAELAKDSSMYLTDSNGNPTDKIRSGSLLDTFNSKAKKEGQIMVRVNFETEQAVKEARAAAQSSGQAFTKEMEDSIRVEKVTKHISGLTADDLAKQGSVFAAIKAGDAEVTSYLKERASNDKPFIDEAMKKMKQSGRDTFYEANIANRPRPSETQEGQAAKERMSERRERQRQSRESKAKPSK